METMDIVEQSVKLNRKGAEMLMQRFQLQDQIIFKTMAELRTLVLMLREHMAREMPDPPIH